MALEDRRFYQEQCTRCSQCKFVPMPQSQAFSSACPSIDHGQFHAFSGGGKLITAYALTAGQARINQRLIESVYACTMCGACDTLCKTNQGDSVEPLDTLYELRATLAADGHVPPAHAELMHKLRAQGTHLGQRDQRSLWAEGLQLKDATRERVQVLLHVGSSNAYDRAAWPQLHTLVRLLKAAGVDFGIAYDAESDAGGLAYDLGFQDDARRLAQSQAERVQRSGATVLLSACAEAYAAFRNHYPRLGVSLGDVRVVHSTDFLEELLEGGKLSLQVASDLTVTYHDPCRLGRGSEPFVPWQGEWIPVMNTMLASDSPRPVRFGNGGNYEAPRRLLSRVQGLKLVEMERNRQFAYCCGAGAATPQAYPQMADMAAVNRLREAEATGATCVVTACSGCERHLANAARAHGMAIQVRSVFDLLGAATERQGQPADLAPLI